MAGAKVYSAYAEGTHSYSAARKRRAAFEANVAENLSAHSAEDGIKRLALVRALGAAHVRVRHALEARTTFQFGTGRFYVVVQAGLARRQPQIRARGAGPLAERVLARIDPDLLGGLSADERARIASAIDTAEITRPHPVDFRMVLPLPGLRAYANFIAGRDKRSDALNATDNRRAPANETLGFLLFGASITAISLLGASLIGNTIIGALEIASDSEGRAALWRMTASLFGLADGG